MANYSAHKSLILVPLQGKNNLSATEFPISWTVPNYPSKQEAQCNISWHTLFETEDLLAPSQTNKLEGHVFSAVGHSLLNTFTETLHLSRHLTRETRNYVYLSN